MELTLVRTLDTTLGRGVTKGEAEPATEVTSLAILETKSWWDDPTDGSIDIAESTLLRTLGRRLASGSILARLMLEMVLRLLVRLTGGPGTEVPLAGVMLETEFR